MRGISSGAFMFFFGLIILVEVLGFFAVMQLIKTKTAKIAVSVVYCTITLIFIGLFLSAYLSPSTIRQTDDYSFFYFVVFITFINLVPKILLSTSFILSLPFRLLKSNTLAKAMLLSGAILSFGAVVVIAYGGTWGRKTIRVENMELELHTLPAGLEGLKIIHISDLHLGGFRNTRFLERLTSVVNAESPDLILFTGDMVNNFYHEMDGMKAPLGKLHARYGKLAILGNHDYGDYSDWHSEEDKINNRKQIQQGIRDAGFRLLLNESVRVAVNDTAIYIGGVENWGNPPFPRYADLDAALRDVPDNSFSVLMTHDPDHWAAQILGKTDIPLTLSGHSHGGQFAFKIAGIEFSPIRLVSAQWGGLYGNSNQYLYVNRGAGNVGLLARIDMNPEVTVITLTQSRQ